MGKGWLKSEWLKHIAVAVGYAIVYELQHPFSQPQFVLGSAVRLVCLLFLPYRYWPALAVGEFIPNWLVVYPCLEQLGIAWVAVRAIPPLVAIMPVVWWCRSKLSLFPTKDLVNVNALLVCAIASSLAWTAYSYGAQSLAIIRPDDVPQRPVMALGYFTGYFFSMVALVPWVLIARFEYRKGPWRNKLREAIQSRLLLDGLMIMVPAVVLLGLISFGHRAVYQPYVLMAMFLPVTVLTIHHGWRGAAFGGTITIICAAIIAPSQMRDASATVIQTELFLSVIVTCLFAVGARISAQLMQEKQKTQDALNIHHLARQAYQQGELRMRKTAQSLEYVAGTLHVTNGKLLQHIRRIYPHIDNESYYKQAMTAHDQVYRLAESLHPIAWRERGLPAALHETVGRVLDEAGIIYSCQIMGRGFTRIQPSVLAAAYRAVCEALVYVCARMSCSSIRVTLRGGETNGARWLFVGVKGSMDDMKVVRAIHHATDRQRIAAKLGAHGLDLGELRDHVRLFDGDLHHRAGHEEVSVSMLLHDAKTVGERRDGAATPLRLWVQ
jgi:glucose-6-phosphate-specific signal transduction histidine kinase